MSDAAVRDAMAKFAEIAPDLSCDARAVLDMMMRSSTMMSLAKMAAISGAECHSVRLALGELKRAGLVLPTWNGGPDEPDEASKVYGFTRKGWGYEPCSTT